MYTAHDTCSINVFIYKTKFVLPECVFVWVRVRSLNKSKRIAHFCCQYTLVRIHTQPHRHSRRKKQNRLKLSFILPRTIFARHYTYAKWFYVYLFKLGADRWFVQLLYIGFFSTIIITITLDDTARVHRRNELSVAPTHTRTLFADSANSFPRFDPVLNEQRRCRRRWRRLSLF